MINLKTLFCAQTWSRSLQAAAVAACVFQAAWLLPSQAQAQTTVGSVSSALPALTQQIPLEDFFKRSQFRLFVPSADGKYIATTAEINGRFNLVVIDLEKRTATAVTNWDNIDVDDPRWVGSKWLVYTAQQLGAPTGQTSRRAGGLFVVSKEGKQARQLAKTQAQQEKGGSSGISGLEFISGVEGSEDEIYAQGSTGGEFFETSAEVYKVNLVTGKDKLVTRGAISEGVERWILDNKDIPRVAFVRGKGASTEFSTYYRSAVGSDWKLIRKFDGTKPPAFVPLAFDADDKIMFVAANEGRDNMAIYRFDPETNKILDQVAQHPQYDMGAAPNGEAIGRLFFDPETDKLRGLRVDADRPTVVWLDPEIAKVQESIDQTFPGFTNNISKLKNGTYAVASFSDLSPGKYYIYDPVKKNIESIGVERPWLENKLANVVPFKLKTRDGLEIPSYYVLPRGYKAGTKLPTIVHIHGGPFARDVEQGGRFGYSFGVTEAQILASRGYAVVLANFRITTELGSKIYYAGFGTYGKEMLDDHEDAAKWAVSQGFADAKKICISGASYGGYAALQAVTRPTNPFACSISGLPPTDLNWQRSNADYSRSPASVEYWRKVQGVPSFSDPLVRETSPLFNAEKIKVPVFMYVGEEDTRVPPRQAARMRDAMAAAGNPMKDYYVGKGEGHGFGVTKHNIELYERMLKFLGENLK